MSSPILRIQDVDKSFRSVHGPHSVLKKVSFEVAPGEVVCLVGRSGSGKSTILRTINALETIDDGEIEVCGLSYRDSRIKPHQLRRNTAMIFQRFELFPHLTAVENVALAPRCVLKKSHEEARWLAQDLLEQVGLKDHLDKYPRTLSGGQQQRVAIARALATDPKVLLCDEPTSALDPELVNEVLDILTAIAKRGMTMLIVTHEMRFAASIASRCLFLEEGEILEARPAAEFFNDPQTPRLKEFLRRVQH
jgi:ABC-type polar amino acid transport system ATPase subunit